jgi:glycosyltransferase involved in cell wall biosynthesis
MVSVSVVIPLYNKALYIEQTIKCVFEQTIQDFEIVVVDDGSTDDGYARVAAIKDSRVKLISQENAGAGAARNRGILEARTDFIAFLDADDEWETDHLEVLLSLRDEFPDAGLYATVYKTKYSNNNYKINLYKNNEGIMDYFLLGGHFKFYPQYIQVSSCAFNKRTIEKIAYFNEARNGQDIDFFSRVALDYDIACALKGFSVYRFDRAELVMNKLERPTQGEYARRVDFLSSKLLEERAALWDKYFILCAKSYIDKKKGLLDYLWSRQIRFIALFVFWGYRKEAYEHFKRTLKFYEKLPRSKHLVLALFFFLFIMIFPSSVLRFICNHISVQE